MSNAVVPIDADEPVKQTEQEPVAQKKYVENNDTFQKLLTIVKMGGELFKVTMACLLVVFVPQVRNVFGMIEIVAQHSCFSVSAASEPNLQ